MNTLFFRLMSALSVLTLSPLVSATQDTVDTVSSVNTVSPVNTVPPLNTVPSASSLSSSTPATLPEVIEHQIIPPSNPLITHDLSAMGMYHAADWVVKSVMISLFIASIISWAIFLAKQIQLVRASKRTTKLLSTLVQSESIQNAEVNLSNHKASELILFTAVQHELHLSSLGHATPDGIKERVQLRLERVQTELSRKMTSLTGILATVGSISPFVGLFGTVWGIMNAFIGIAKSKSTTLVVVAPGIAEALLATAIGLIAAIPAVIMYNYFTRFIGKYRALVTDVSAASMVLVSRELDRKSHNETNLKSDIKKAG
ncbi:MAG: tonB-system energizer ExbB [Vibrio gallaecicus]|uniref:tonB-system energizer ExbB n=1 Tax=Vibrio gallaecicus TaxID=552386 RepID=UPI0010C9442F|nr:tonB-system energizer ExbB [Vibrio gallaecicus]MDN3617145.1 tonB-system energizer ExbB [Vibrio gallaecicus]